MTGGAASPRPWDRPAAEEGQAIAEIAQRLTTVRRRGIARHLFRAVYHANLGLSTPPNPLFFAGSVAGRRYTPVGGPAGLYLSFDQATTVTELRLLSFLAGEPVAAPHDPVVICTVEVRVDDLLDLTDVSTCNMLALTRAELDEDWETRQAAHIAGVGARPAGQLLALVAHAMQTFSGIVFQSRRSDFGSNLMLFPDRLYVDERVEVVDSTGVFRAHLDGPCVRGRGTARC